MSRRKRKGGIQEVVRQAAEEAARQEGRSENPPACVTYSDLKDLYGTPKNIFDYFCEMSQEEFDCYRQFCDPVFDTIECLRFLRFLTDVTNGTAGKDVSMLESLIKTLEDPQKNIYSFTELLRTLGISDKGEVEWAFEMIDVIEEVFNEVFKAETYRKDPQLVLSTYSYLFNRRECAEEFFDDLLILIYKEVDAEMEFQNPDELPDTIIE